MNQYDLQGRTAAVTGGCRGIGLATAERLASSGARIRLWDIDVTTMEKVCTAHPGWTWDRVDVTSEDDVRTAVDRTVDALGRIDVLVNAAGIAGSRAPVIDCSLAEWRRVVAVNLEGTFICCREVVRNMRKTGYGRIVNLSSMAGKDGNPLAAHYSAAKAGVIALTKSLAKENVDLDIRVNAIAPAAIASDLFYGMPLENQRIAAGRIPLGRVGKVEEVAATIAWMASEDCSFTTGFTFDMSGGRATY